MLFTNELDGITLQPISEVPKERLFAIHRNDHMYGFDALPLATYFTHDTTPQTLWSKRYPVTQTHPTQDELLSLVSILVTYRDVIGITGSINKAKLVELNVRISSLESLIVLSIDQLSLHARVVADAIRRRRIHQVLRQRPQLLRSFVKKLSKAIDKDDEARQATPHENECEHDVGTAGVPDRSAEDDLDLGMQYVTLNDYASRLFDGCREHAIIAVLVVEALARSSHDTDLVLSAADAEGENGGDANMIFL